MSHNISLYELPKLNWCKEELSLGHLEAIEGHPRFIIFIMVDDINVGEIFNRMQKYVKTQMYIDIEGYFELFRKELLYAMPHTPIKDFNVDHNDEYNPFVP